MMTQSSSSCTVQGPRSSVLGVKLMGEEGVKDWSGRGNFCAANTIWSTQEHACSLISSMEGSRTTTGSIGASALYSGSVFLRHVNVSLSLSLRMKAESPESSGKAKRRKKSAKVEIDFSVDSLSCRDIREDEASKMPLTREKFVTVGAISSAWGTLGGRVLGSLSPSSAYRFSRSLFPSSLSLLSLLYVLSYHLSYSAPESMDG
mmetsp:Transcript_1669/g.3063  ORF Transcript_1669/g.3063 Transcript_1669/m.3063 type:complete len:204 (+) Transcript_1669:10959-11570(+)